jgi:oligoribonuclease NrnB/cAMP/cGMP phosphodiesterase (DHH superfamily)
LSPPDRKHLVVVYHEACIDGLASAWAFEQRFGLQENVHVSYIPLGHHDIPAAEEKIRRELDAGTEVFFVDVAPSKTLLDAIMAPLTSGLPPAKSVTVIDHHKSAADIFAGYQPPQDAQAPKLSLQFDADHPSAANMVWEVLLPERGKPEFLKLIAKMDIAKDIKEERDLAAAAMIDSKPIKNIADAFYGFQELSTMSMHEMVVGGQSILSDQANRIQKLTDNIMYTRLAVTGAEVIWVPVINADVQNFGRHISDYLREQGDRTGLGMAFAWYVQGNGSVTMSIRSDGEPDASKIAEFLCAHKGMKGGGHKTSAAVHFISLQQFTDIIPLYTLEQMNQIKKAAAVRQA